MEMKCNLKNLKLHTNFQHIKVNTEQAEFHQEAVLPPFSPKSSAPIIIEGSGWGQRRQRALAVHMWQEVWTRGISPLPSQHRFICNRKSAATTVFQECLKMATGQIPITDISIIL